MVKLIKNLIDKYKEIILYLIFGVLTTAVNYIIYFVFSNILCVHYLMSNIIAWILSVIFAYITNRIYVFNSKSKGKNKINEFITFVGARVFSGIMETVIMYVGVDLLNINDLIIKLTANILVIILNYIFSKLFIFKKSKNST